MTLSEKPMSKMNEIALRRLQCWLHTAKEKDILQEKALAFELGQLGFWLENICEFTSIGRAEFVENLAVLQAMRGSDVQYVPLFSHFPDDLPNDETYLAQRILSIFFGQNTFSDLSRFGADPATQRQRPDLWQQAAEVQAKRFNDSQVEWISLSLVSWQAGKRRLARWASDLIYQTTPVKEALWQDIFDVLSCCRVEVDVEKIVVKETLARLAAHEWQLWDKLIVRTPTDLLRMFAFMCGQDVSLSEQVDLKGLRFSKVQRRIILAFLNQCSSLAENLLLYKRLWISLSRWLHPGDYAKRFPKVVRAFDDLRNDRVKSFDSVVVNAAPTERVGLLLSRPSLLLRKLSWLLKETSPESVAEAVMSLHQNVEQIPLPLLLSAYCALDYEGSRVVINKQGNPHTVKARGAIGETLGVMRSLESLILEKLRGKKEWTTVWIDPAIDKLILPFQARKQSDGLLNLARGSRISIGDTEVIRLFVYWHQQQKETDLDLSAMLLNANFKYISHVAWNQYGEGKEIAHSGDIVTAPLGAAEFIDIRLASVQGAYLVPTVLRYRGEPFPLLKTCYAGWMNRRDVGSDMKSFDARTVVEKVEVNRGGKLWIPFVLDIAAGELVFVDLYSQGARTVERNEHFPELTAGIANYWRAKPTFGQLARWYAKANDANVVDRDIAATTIGMADDCDINVLSLVGQGVTSF